MDDTAKISATELGDAASTPSFSTEPSRRDEEEKGRRRRRPSKEQDADRTSPRKQRRAMCVRCERPSPAACLCPALPPPSSSSSSSGDGDDDGVVPPFRKCRVVVLQHPHEARRKNRSLFVVDLCVGRDRAATHRVGVDVFDDADVVDVTTVVARRWGDAVPARVAELVKDEARTLLLWPRADDAVSLREGIRELGRRRPFRNDDVDDKITLLLLDATWRHANETYRKSVATGSWPERIVRVRLSPDDDDDDDGPPPGYRPRRFDAVRAPPADDGGCCLSTAECVAWAASKVEGDDRIYATIVKPLDYMAALRRGHRRRREAEEETQPNDDGDDDDPSGKNVLDDDQKGKRPEPNET